MKLKNKDTIVVVGGGPAGAFFAIHFLRLAKLRGLAADLVIIEKKGEAGPGEALPHFSCREGPRSRACIPSRLKASRARSFATWGLSEMETADISSPVG
jgi:NADPH-dependent 2,4-dienoyl-CoA reductase/sulfur reductase-like enzyme